MTHCLNYAIKDKYPRYNIVEILYKYKQWIMFKTPSSEWYWIIMDYKIYYRKDVDSEWEVINYWWRYMNDEDFLDVNTVVEFYTSFLMVWIIPLCWYIQLTSPNWDKTYILDSASSHILSIIRCSMIISLEKSRK